MINFLSMKDFQVNLSQDLCMYHMRHIISLLIAVHNTKFVGARCDSNIKQPMSFNLTCLLFPFLGKYNRHAACSSGRHSELLTSLLSFPYLNQVKKYASEERPVTILQQNPVHAYSGVGPIELSVPGNWEQNCHPNVPNLCSNSLFILLAVLLK